MSDVPAATLGLEVGPPLGVVQEVRPVSDGLVLEVEAAGDSSVDFFPLRELPPLLLQLSLLLPGDGPDLDDRSVLHRDLLPDVDTEPPVRHVDHNDVDHDEDGDEEKYMEQLRHQSHHWWKLEIFTPIFDISQQLELKSVGIRIVKRPISILSI